MTYVLSDYMFSVTEDMEPKHSITVETQEQNLAKCFRKRKDVSLTVCRLTPYPAGDLFWVTNCALWGAEVKSADDLISSFIGPKQAKLKMSRLDSQLTRMFMCYDYVVLFIRVSESGMHVTTTGKIETSYGIRHVMWNALWNRLLWWQATHGLIIEWVTDNDHIADRVVSMKQYCEGKEKERQDDNSRNTNRSSSSSVNNVPTRNRTKEVKGERRAGKAKRE